MADRVEVVAEAQKKSLGSLRLQEKYNVVRAYEAIGARQDEFVKDWNKTTGKALNFPQPVFQFPVRIKPFVGSKFKNPSICVN